jgi:glutathione S-transferase
VKLYDAVGPNPRLVRMFLAEKGLSLDTEQVDIMAGENRQPPYTERNPFGQMPALELDDGGVLTETTVICEYLEEKHPTPVLVGATPEERAETRMWTRRAVLNVIEPMSSGFRFAEGLSMFQDRMRCMPDAAADFKAVAQDGLALFDRLIGDGPFLAGDRFSLADVTLYTLLDFFAGVGQPLDPKLGNVGAWFQRVAARPSAEESLHPVAKAGGMRA